MTLDKKAELKRLTTVNLPEISKYDLARVVDRAIESFGPYQKFIFIALCMNSVVSAICNTITAFHIFTPDEFICVEDSFESTNSSCVVGCRKYKFFDLATSVVTEWSLICDKRYLSALINTVYFAGPTVGSILCGVMADHWGRRKVIIWTLYLQGIAGACLYFSYNLEMFMLLRFIQGFLIPGLHFSSYTLMQELTPPRKLTVTGLTWDAIWAIGMVILGVVSYFVHDWRTLQLVLALPTLLTVSWIWLLPESPKWYLSKDKKLLALKQSIEIAERNKDSAFFDDCCAMKLVHMKVAEPQVPCKISEESGGKLLNVFKSSILLKHLCVMMMIWFSANWAYYGVLLFTPNLSGGRHLNFIIGALIEIVTCLVAFFALSSRFGRRISIIFFQYLTSAIFVGFGLLLFFGGSETWISYATASIAQIGKGIIVCVIAGMHVYGAELFPTVVRSSATGILVFSEGVGSLTAPQIVLLGELIHPSVTMLIIAALLFLGGTATFLLPETLNKKLPDTMADVEESWRKR